MDISVSNMYRIGGEVNGGMFSNRVQATVVRGTNKGGWREADIVGARRGSRGLGISLAAVLQNTQEE